MCKQRFAPSGERWISSLSSWNEESSWHEIEILLYFPLENKYRDFDIFLPERERDKHGLEGSSARERRRKRKERKEKWTFRLMGNGIVATRDPNNREPWKFCESRCGWKYFARVHVPQHRFATLSTERYLYLAVGPFLFRRMCDRSRTRESASGVMAGGQW